MSLQVWYPFNGDFVHQGLSPVSGNLSDTGHSFVDGKLGKCLYHNKQASNWITADGLVNADMFSISTWIKLEESDMASAGNFGDFFNVEAVADTYTGHIRIEHANNTNTPGRVQSLFCRDISSTGASTAYVGWNSYDTGYKWFHEVITFDGSDARFYINGELKSTLTKSDIFVNSYNLTGRFQLGSGSIVKMNDFRIYNHCLSLKEIKEVSKGLILHYPMNQVDGIIGGRNLIANSDWEIEKVFGKVITSPAVVFVNNIDFSSLIGKRLIFSYDVVRGGAYVAGEGSLGNRFGIHGTVIWKNSSTGETSVKYPFANHLASEIDDRVSMYYDLVQPSGYDTIQTFAFSVQLYASPSEDNTTCPIWKIGHPKLELYKETPWTPAPEDNAIYNDTTVYDTSGFNNHGSVAESNAPTWDNDSAIGSGSYKFYGQDRLDLANLSYENMESGSVSLWLKINSFINWDHYLGICNGFNWTATEKDFIIVAKSGSGTGSNAVSIDCCSYVASFTPVLGKWNHIVITWDKSDYKIKRYVNGDLLSQTDDSTNKRLDIYSSKHSYHRLGVFNNDTDCSMTDFKVYATALSADDVKSIYQTRFSLADNGILFCSEYIEDSSVNLSSTGIVNAPNMSEDGDLLSIYSDIIQLNEIVEN